MRRSAHAPRVWLNPVAVWELLDRLGISQNELARRCGFSPGHLSMLMNGKRSPSHRARRRLMEVLGVDDFDRLFIMEPPALLAETQGGPSPQTKKGCTQGHWSTPPDQRASSDRQTEPNQELSSLDLL